MAASKNDITAAGLRKLEEELKRREGETRDQINARLREAREFGDLSENAEYDAAREEQAANDSRINELKHIIATAKIAEVNENDLTAAVGTKVKLENAQGHQLVFSLVATTETNSLLNQISNESPVGEALVGHRTGDEISFMMPSGKMATYRIVGIEIAEASDSDE